MTPPGLLRGKRLARHTSLKVGGPAEAFVVTETAEQIAQALAWAAEAGLSSRIIGGGSNLLVAEAGVDGLVLKLASSRMRVVAGEDGRWRVVANAGVTIANLARRVSQQGYGGLEWASNVPGTVGGAVANNAGAFGGDTASSLLAATIVDAQGTLRYLAPAELGYAYRASKLKRRELGTVAVVEAELRVEPTDAAEAVARVRQYQAQRTRSQPRQLSAGSVFANPPGDYAGRLIEAAGLKGYQVGGAAVSTQHANFIVNLGGATADDVYDLVRHVQATVRGQHGVWLIPEIELFGRWSLDQRRALYAAEL